MSTTSSDKSDVESDARFLRTITLGAVSQAEWERVSAIANRLDEAERKLTPAHPSGWTSRLDDAEFMRELLRRGFVRGSRLGDRFGAIADRLDAVEEREMRIMDWLLARAGGDERDDRYQAVHKILRTGESTSLQDARSAYAAEHPTPGPHPRFTAPPSHECEEWMMNDDGLSGSYCRACGEYAPRVPHSTPPNPDPNVLGWVAAWPTNGETDAIIRWDNRQDAETYVRSAKLIDPTFCVGRVVRDD